MCVCVCVCVCVCMERERFTASLSLSLSCLSAEVIWKETLIALSLSPPRPLSLCSSFCEMSLALSFSDHCLFVNKEFGRKFGCSLRKVLLENFDEL